MVRIATAGDKREVRVLFSYAIERLEARIDKTCRYIFRSFTFNKEREWYRLSQLAKRDRRECTRKYTTKASKHAVTRYAAIFSY